MVSTALECRTFVQPERSRERFGNWPRTTYIIVDARRAGGPVNMIWFDDPAATVAAIKARGLEPTEIGKHDPV